MSLISSFRSVMKFYHHYFLGNKSHCPSKTIIIIARWLFITHHVSVKPWLQLLTSISATAFQICHVLLTLIHSLFAVTANVEGASLFEPSFFLFTTKTIGLSTRMEKNLKVCGKNTLLSWSVNNKNIIPKTSYFFSCQLLPPTARS